MKRKKFTPFSVSHYIRIFFIASILLLISIAILTASYHSISMKNEEQTCYNILLDSTSEASSKIENSFKNDIVSLRMLSKVIAKYDNLESEDVNNQVTAYAVNSYITNIAIITKDNKIIQTRYKNVYQDRISFDEEISKGEHTSGLQKSVFSNNLVIRNYVPIRSKSNKQAILFTEIDPVTLARVWQPEIYDGHASFCIVDTTSGQIIMSTLSDSYTNINHIDNTLHDDIINNSIDYRTISLEGKKCLVAYRPMNIENWKIIFIVEEQYVMESVKNIKNISYIFLSIGSGIFIIYLIWTILFSIRIIKLTKSNANIDVLTGLENRNNYEEFCSKQKNTEKLACIFIDVNGLHIINNTKGHLAGDMMLKYIAETLKIYFKDSNIYRIGGDEFIIFNHNSDNEECIKKAYSDIVKNDYHIAYGIKIGYFGLHISDLIKQSETLMYDMKSKYYESIGQPVRNIIE